jgi:hypothetical protein
MKLYNDWRPETKSLLATLTRAGFTLVSGEHENLFKYAGNLDKFIEELTACDDVTLRVSMGDANTSCGTWIRLVFGNSPGELVCDYGIPRDVLVAERLEAAIASHSEAWEGKKQPKLTEEEYMQRIRPTVT